jgi:hypothetical protein
VSIHQKNNGLIIIKSSIWTGLDMLFYCTGVGLDLRAALEFWFVHHGFGLCSLSLEVNQYTGLNQTHWLYNGLRTKAGTGFNTSKVWTVGTVTLSLTGWKYEYL